MIDIDGTLVSLDIIEKEFCCDLAVCKGQCCISGDSGAPLEEEEILCLENVLPTIWPDISRVAQKKIKKHGVAVIDQDGDLVTPIIDGKNCVYTTYTEDGKCICAIEKAYMEKKISFRKPISYQLYPIRLKEYKDFTAVNYNEWDICSCALKKGKSIKLPLYKFLKEPLIRKFGEDWYKKLELIATEWLKQKKS